MSEDADEPRAVAVEDDQLSALQQQIEATHGSRRIRDGRSSGGVAPAGTASPPGPSAFRSGELGRAPPSSGSGS
jgi:hypothetical protein